MSDDRPQPRYGEYAPGYVPGSDSSAPRDPVPPGSTTTPPSVPPPAVPPPSPWTPSGQAPVGSTYAPPPVRPRRTGDVIATIILLVLGLVGTLIACAYAAIFANPTLLNEGLKAQGHGAFHGQVGNAPLILVLSHVVLYLVVLTLSILGLVRRRITFWIPLVAGVIAAVVFWTVIIMVLASDPSFTQQAGL